MEVNDDNTLVCEALRVIQAASPGFEPLTTASDTDPYNHLVTALHIESMLRVQFVHGAISLNYVKKETWLYFLHREL